MTTPSNVNITNEGDFTMKNSATPVAADVFTIDGSTGNTAVAGTLGVTGNTSLSTLGTSGLATLNSAAVTNNATVGGTLGVTGLTSLNGGVNTTNVNTSGNVIMSNAGDLTIKDATNPTPVDRFTVDGATGNTMISGT
ncbi:MAG: hypothetical protein ACK55I_13965, partial [bacterium]